MPIGNRIVVFLFIFVVIPSYPRCVNFLVPSFLLFMLISRRIPSAKPGSVHRQERYANTYIFSSFSRSTQG